ncbi:MAG: DUF2313 domain-containing protein [Lachnospiraceae bacterium]|nr:DUF2313 domain-containing protein [Lachnospiraceae bacterium]
MSEVFYNRQRSGFEELQSYQPLYYRNIKEMVAINKASGYMLDRMADDLEKTFDEHFLNSCSEETLKMFEDFLEIDADYDTTIEDRKSVVKLKWQGGGKINRTKIKALIREYANCDCSVNLTDSQLIIDMRFTDDPAQYMPAIRNVINNSQIPAHIEIYYHGDSGVVYQLIWNFKTNLEKIYMRMSSLIYKADCLDGSRLLDGNNLLNSLHGWFPVAMHTPLEVKEPSETFEFWGKEKREYDNISKSTQDIAIRHISICENVDTAAVSDKSCITVNSMEGSMVPKYEVVISINYHELDGSLYLDGNTILNAERIKEEL